MDREGEYTFSLRPRSEKYAHRLVCEVKVLGNVKQVVLRSTYKIENHTLYPLELTLVDETGQPVYAVEKIGMLGKSATLSFLAHFAISPRSGLCSTTGCRQPLPSEAATRS